MTRVGTAVFFHLVEWPLDGPVQHKWVHVLLQGEVFTVKREICTDYEVEELEGIIRADLP